MASMRRVSLGLAVAALSTASFTGGAQAATLGSVTPPPGSELAGCGAGVVIAQATSDASTPYTVPGPGRITDWQTNASQSNPGAAVTLVVLRPSGDSFSVVGTDPEAILDVPLDSILSYKIPSPIKVSGGETLGLYTGQNGGVVCIFQGGQTPPADTLAALSAGSTPAAGQTLDRLISDSPPGFLANVAVTFVPGAGKKCRKKHKKRSAAAAKKKKCKRRKKR
jgi:hypothetical protein